MISFQLWGKHCCLVHLSLFFFPLQAHAASAVLNFSENCTPDILTPYLDVIVTKLLVLLQVYEHPHREPNNGMFTLVYILLFDDVREKCVDGT